MPKAAALAKIVERLREIEDGSGRGTVDAGRARISVSNLAKIYYPEGGFTKGDLMRYYARIAPFILPAIADRPLVLKRFPNGIDGKSFFQQKAPANVPAGVRVADVETEDKGIQPRIVGGDLPTLLYIVQLGTVAIHPWLSRLRSQEEPDYAVLDLDPQPGAGFATAVDVARWIHDDLDALGIAAVPKTSGSRGIHICIPLPRGATFELATDLTRGIAERVAAAHPRVATTERSVSSRPSGSVYVDFLQNARGKSVTAPYSARARKGATVSAPLRWDEVVPSLRPGDFTIESMPERAAAADLWAEGMRPLVRWPLW